MSETPRRRWFQFGLRSMFVAIACVAILAAWIGYSLNWIRQRQEFLATKEVYDLSGGGGLGPEIRPSAPSLLWVFGEKGIRNLIVMGSDDAKFLNAGLLFPEAKRFHHPHDAANPDQTP